MNARHYRSPRLSAYPVCAASGKHSFPQRVARLAARNLRETGAEPRVYKCGDCRLFHVAGDR